MKLSVVIPVYSEEEALREVVRGLFQRVPDVLHQIILIVSPKSGARTFAVCEALTRTDPRVECHVQQENPGIGRAYKQAFARVTGTHVLIIDADGEMDLDAVPKFVEAARQGAELVLGSRWIRGGGAVGYDRTTYVLNRGFQSLFRLLFRTRVHDLTYGFKLFDARLLTQVHWWGTLHEIAMETTLKPLKLRYRVREIPTVWRKRTEGYSKAGLRKRLRYVPHALRILLASRDEL